MSDDRKSSPTQRKGKTAIPDRSHSTTYVPGMEYDSAEEALIRGVKKGLELWKKDQREFQKKQKSAGKPEA